MTSDKNPWLTIWAHPKQTMRHILENYPLRLIHTFAILGAFTQVVSGTLAWYSWWVTLIIWVSLSIFFGLLTLYVFGGLLKWTGGWLKGAGSFQDIRASIAWSQLPVFVFFIIKLILLVLVRGNSGSFFYSTVLFVLGIWSIIIFLCCLAEAQRFSFFKALVNYLLSVLIVVAASAVVVLLASLFSGNMV